LTKRPNALLRAGAQRAHEHCQGPARDVYPRYARRRLEHAVPRAVVEGIIDRDPLPADLLDALRGAIELFEDVKPGSEESAERGTPRAER
ncbi:MAG: hypothetical protein ACRD2T_09065, partial [Thermoanaerobaculia bacterium]